MARIENYVALNTEFKKTVATKPRDYWMPRLEENDVPYAPINTLNDVFEDPQVKHLGTFYDVEHPNQGKQTSARRPISFDGSRDDQPKRPPPELGEHTEEVLAELGLDADAVKDLRGRGVI
jgi:crotonobetainyl-CoA:carnitine CoA-transferase CaiB-like acyl-CoA transferase